MSVEFGIYLKQVREARGLSQTKLAERADIDTSYISRLEGGRRDPSAPMVDRLADALGIDRKTVRMAAFGYPDDPPELHRLRSALASLPTVQQILIGRQLAALADTAEFHAAYEAYEAIP